MEMFLSFVVWLLLSSCSQAQQDGDEFNPFGRETCVPLDSIVAGMPPGCLNLELLPCEEKVIANFSAGNFFDQGAVLEDATPICQEIIAPFPLGDTGCEACLMFTTFDVTPSSAHVLPYLNMKQSATGPPCALPQGNLVEFPDEIVLGTDCGSPTCGSCMSTPGCGWCESSGTCIAGGTIDGEGLSTDPYCDGDCDLASWVPTGFSVQCQQVEPEIVSITFSDFCKISFDVSVTEYTCEMPHSIDDLSITYEFVGNGGVLVILDGDVVRDTRAIAIPHDHESFITIEAIDENSNIIQPEYDVTIRRVDVAPTPPSDTPIPVPQKAIIKDLNIEQCGMSFDRSKTTYACHVDDDTENVKLYVYTDPENALDFDFAVSVEVDSQPLEDWHSPGEIELKMNFTTRIAVILIEKDYIVENYGIDVTRGAIPDEADSPDGSTVPSTEVIIGMTIGSIGLVALFAAFLLCKRTSRMYDQLRKHSMRMNDTSMNQRRISAGGGSSGLAMTPQKNTPRRYTRLDEDHEEDDVGQTRPPPPPPPKQTKSINQTKFKSPDGQTSLLSDQDAVVGLGPPPKKKPSSSFSRLVIEDDDEDDEEDDESGGIGPQATSSAVDTQTTSSGGGSEVPEVAVSYGEQSSGDHIQAEPEDTENVKKVSIVVSEGQESDLDGKNKPLLAQESDQS